MTKPLLTSFAAGLLFGTGLTVSQMVDPAKVVGFLDVAGAWDPSLALVMGGALLTSAIGYRFVLRRPTPLLSEAFRMPTARDVDGPLLGGAALFGAGWGLSGFCPGPAVCSLVFAEPGAYAFLLAMLAGIALRERGSAAGEAKVRPELQPDG